MATCSYPGCDCEIYQGDKCIFHCEKTEQNGWISPDGKTNGNVHLFWSKFEKIVREKSEYNFTFTRGYIIPQYKTGDTRGLEHLDEIIFKECTFVDSFDFIASKTKQFSVVNSKIEKPFRVDAIRGEGKNAYVQIFDSEINHNVFFFGNSRTILDKCTLDKNVKINIWGCPKDSFIEIKSINNQALNGEIIIQQILAGNITINQVNINKLKINEIHIPEEGKFIIDFCKINLLRFADFGNLGKNAKIKNSVIHDALYFNNVDLSDISFNNFDISECACLFNKVNIVNARLNSVFWTKKENSGSKSIWQRLKLELKPEVVFLKKFDLENFKKIIETEDIIFTKGATDKNKIVHFDKIIPKEEFIDIVTQLKINYDNCGQYDLANKFYCLEMNLRKDNCDSFFQKLVFHINSFISSFGQSYIKALFVLLLSVAIASSFYEGCFNNLLDIITKVCNNYDGTRFVLEKIIPFLNGAVSFILPFAYSDHFSFMTKGHEFIGFLYIIWCSIVVWHIIISVKRINKR